jgi:hypothetical protein
MAPLSDADRAQWAFGTGLPHQPCPRQNGFAERMIGLVWRRDIDHIVVLTEALAPDLAIRTPAGATVAAIRTATEWQQHSVRGFLAGVVRKKLGLNLVSESTDKGRVYRIKASSSKPSD